MLEIIVDNEFTRSLIELLSTSQALNFAGLPRLLHFDLLKVEPTDMPCMALVNSKPECWYIVDGA